MKRAASCVPRWWTMTMGSACALVVFFAPAMTSRAEPAPSGPATESPCLHRLAAAKKELIDRDFKPTADRDTARWLDVYEHDGDAGMILMMGGADGPHVGYRMDVGKQPRSGTRAIAWRLRTHELCCDDNHEASDHIINFQWTTTKAGYTAEVAVDRFRAALKDPDDSRYAKLFIEVARHAADDCIHDAAPIR